MAGDWDGLVSLYETAFAVAKPRKTCLTVRPPRRDIVDDLWV